jgi:P27 family predicted phage terminase small subunit
MPGPPPKPTALRIYEGNRSHRPLNDREPTPLTGEPPMPRHLDALARKEWKRLTPLLLSMRVLSEADGLALANLCMTYSTLVQAQRLMLKAAKGSASPLLMKTPSGYIQQSPLLGIINSQMAALTVQLREFGLSPASRTRVQTLMADGGIDRLEQLLCGDL